MAIAAALELRKIERLEDWKAGEDVETRGRQRGDDLDATSSDA